MIAPLAPIQPPLGAGVHCDVPVLPELEIFLHDCVQVIRRNRNRGMP
jgi:hypothetical protein